MLSTSPINSLTANNEQALQEMPRIAIEMVAPVIDEGRFAIKRVVGDALEVEADIFMDGHDKLAALVVWRANDELAWQSAPMHEIGNSRWRALLPALQRIGRYTFRIEAWYDKFSTYKDELEKKVIAGLDVTLELEEGRLLIERTLAHQQRLANNSQASPAGKKSAANKNSAKTALATVPPAGALCSSLNTTLTAFAHAASTPPAVATISMAPDADHPAPDKESDKEALKQQALANSLQQYDIINRQRCMLLLDLETQAAMQAADPRPYLVHSASLPLICDRPGAAFSSWYELFPRSQSGDANRHGTFDDVIARLPAISAMGFDTLYFPPIHPIGKTNRKGPNNSLDAGPDDPGSPYAIGSSEGGHDAIHPQLGDWEGFRRLRTAAAAHGMEIALDFAIQCSPDHPWLKQHPDWFDWRPDGSIRYAENPPKKYQDIVNVDFYKEAAIPDLWIALRDVVMLWAKEGVRSFRVDNPHTKPFPFWEWLIREVQDAYPGTVFLSEAFTYPKVMHRLSKLGFSQSYTYFTWRNTKAELTEYMNSLTASPVKEFFRPHFFVNTPDINPFFLQNSGRQGFLIRAALAATLSGLWGISSGFELCESEAVRGKEEFLNSEKYEIRAWDWQRTGNIIQEITLLNRLRREHPALQSHLGLRFHGTSNGNVLYFSKNTSRPDSQAFDPLGKQEDLILVAINLDPYAVQETTLEIPLYMFGQPDDGSIQVEDLVGGYRFTWYGKWQQFSLNPFESPFAIWRLYSV